MHRPRGSSDKEPRLVKNSTTPLLFPFPFSLFPAPLLCPMVHTSRRLTIHGRSTSPTHLPLLSLEPASSAPRTPPLAAAHPPDRPRSRSHLQVSRSNQNRLLRIHPGPLLCLRNRRLFILFPVLRDVVGERVVWVGCAKQGLDGEAVFF